MRYKNDAKRSDALVQKGNCHASLRSSVTTTWPREGQRRKRCEIASRGRGVTFIHNTAERNMVCYINATEIETNIFFPNKFLTILFIGFNFDILFS